MSFRNMILDRKGFEVKFGYGMRSRSQSHCDVNVTDSSLVVDGLKQSCWANMPPELLRDVLLRIEASEDTWPARKHVVACAGVCRSWREIMKEIVKPPQTSCKLTFPISLKQVPFVTTIFSLYLFFVFVMLVIVNSIQVRSSQVKFSDANLLLFFCYIQSLELCSENFVIV